MTTTRPHRRCKTRSRRLRPDLSETRRRFHAGDTHRMCGIRFRVEEGRKRPDGSDLVLKWHTASGWRPISFEPVGLLVDFLYENEHSLYPPSEGLLGGDKVERYLRTAIRLGHDMAWAGLQAERAQRTLFEQGDEAA